jgi:phosphate transport system substrate-binding protein
VRIWGSQADAALLQAWSQGFAQAQPGHTARLDLRGPEAPLMGVYTGVAEVALLTREVRVPAETMAFAWAWRYPVTTVVVANAAADTPRPNGDLALWVHPRNPLDHLTLAQVDGIFGAEAKRQAGVLRTWGQLGLTGKWAALPIHAAGPAIDSVSGLYFRHAVLADSYKWNADLRELPSDGALWQTVAGDEAAIGYAPKHGAPPGVKALALAAEAAGPFVALDSATAANRTYPLSRTVVMALNRKPGEPIEPKTLAWLHYILSPAGQAVIAADRTCLPLTPKQVAAQLKKLQ